MQEDIIDFDKEDQQDQQGGQSRLSQEDQEKTVIISKIKQQHMDIAQKKIKYVRKQEFADQIAYKEPEPMKVNCKRLLYQLYFFIVSVGILTLSVYAFRERKIHQEDMDQLLTNWRSGVIMEVNYTQSSTRCSEQFGDEYEQLVIYTWSGTRDACDCLTKDNNNNMTYQTNTSSTNDFFKTNIQIDTVCNTEKLAQGCSSVLQLQSKEFSMWNDGQFGFPFTLCAKRNKNITFINSLSIDGECAEGTRACGQDEYLICMPIDSKCPISRIGFGQDQYYKQIMNGSIDGTIMNVNKISMYYVRSDGMPIAELRISEVSTTQGVCYFNNIGNISPDRKEYPLMQLQRQPCDEDTYFNRISTISEEQFMLANNALYLSQQLPFYIIDDRYQWSMFTKQYIDWNMNCRGTILQDIIDAGSDMTIITTALRLQLIITLTYFVLIGLIMTAAGTASAFNHNISFMKTNYRQQYAEIFLTEIVIKMIIESMEIVGICISFVMIYHKKVTIDQAISMQCSNNTVAMDVFSIIIDDMQAYIWQHNLAILITFSLVFVYDAILLMQAIKAGQVESCSEFYARLSKCIGYIMGRNSQKVHPDQLAIDGEQQHGQ